LRSAIDPARHVRQNVGQHSQRGDVEPEIARVDLVKSVGLGVVPFEVALADCAVAEAGTPSRISGPMSAPPPPLEISPAPIPSSSTPICFARRRARFITSSEAPTMEQPKPVGRSAPLSISMAATWFFSASPTHFR